ncbi:mitotic spindle assembly checkpoint protein MAD2B isoform X2 [Thrips palmi]|uniref:Mitotic spindle assembly checkpoint protein MAD2B isoform X2 n=1 Tax=Thrips palmi TaxID=161013 RepID=A0A6P8YNN4_THRPL|nr:mitotic spindle assembly checkpoint protein MAD2B isoform X2 [Thrips palmi]
MIDNFNYVNSISRTGNLYPPSIFVLRKMYNVPVQVSRHPGLNQYITDSLKSVAALLRRSSLRCVSLCFYNEDERPIERFVFDILEIQENFRTNYDFSDSYLPRLREGFRAFSLKVAAADMKALNDNCSFQIHISTTEQGSQALASDPGFEDFPWIELEDRDRDLSSPCLSPIRTIDSDFLKLQVYREMASR